MNISIVTDHQQQLNATLYIPQNASAENKVPLVITSSGWEDAGESWSYVATELSRRGIAVANMEPYSHGTSGMFYQKGEMALYTNMYSDGMGMVALTDYLTSGILDFIDTDKVGVTGLSMGGICTWTTVQHYGHMYNAAIEQAQSPDSDGGESITEDELLAAQSLLKVTAALPCGSPPTANNGYDPSALHVNVGCLMGSIEECGDLVSTKTSRIVGDAIEGIEFINSSFSVKISIPLENTGVSSVFAISVWPFSLIFSLARRNEGNFFQAVPTTLSSSLAEVRLASLVAWA